MDSSKHGISKSEIVGDDQSVATGQQYDYKVSINKIKNVLKLLITECPFLIDDKALAESQGKNPKEEFTIQIDSIRKALGIDNMDDVELLVLTFYEYSDKAKEEQMINMDGENEEEDEQLYIDVDEIIYILKDFHKKREERANNAELLGNPRMKKRSNFETEEQKKERIKREERIFWEKMTTVLDEKKLSVWRALDKALSQYYSLLVERQNLIEETGLLN